MADYLPFNSIAGDRAVKAEDWAWYFATFIGNGVFPNSANDGLMIKAESGMNISVSPGKAFINGYGYRNSADLILNIQTADGAMKRYDRVVLRWDLIKREIYPEILKGVASENAIPPELTRTSEIYEIALADVLVGKGVTSITITDITDKRYDSDLCGIVTGTVEQIDASTLTAQFNAFFQEYKQKIIKEYNAYINQMTTDYDKYMDKIETDYNTYITNLDNQNKDYQSRITEYERQQTEEFNAWFQSIKDVLDEDVTTAILNQIEEIKNYIGYVKGDNFQYTVQDIQIITIGIDDVESVSVYNTPQFEVNLNKYIDGINEDCCIYLDFDYDMLEAAGKIDYTDTSSWAAAGSTELCIQYWGNKTINYTQTYYNTEMTFDSSYMKEYIDFCTSKYYYYSKSENKYILNDYAPSGSSAFTEQSGYVYAEANAEKLLNNILANDSVIYTLFQGALTVNITGSSIAFNRYMYSVYNQLYTEMTSNLLLSKFVIVKGIYYISQYDYWTPFYAAGVPATKTSGVLNAVVLRIEGIYSVDDINMFIVLNENQSNISIEGGNTGDKITIKEIMYIK